MRVDTRVHKIEHALMRLGGAFVESVETIQELKERINEQEDERETWLERNVAAEGEVTVLRERVDQQDQMIRRLEDKLDRAIKTIQLLSKPEGGEFFFFLTG